MPTGACKPPVAPKVIFGGGAVCVGRRRLTVEPPVLGVVCKTPAASKVIFGGGAARLGRRVLEPCVRIVRVVPNASKVCWFVAFIVIFSYTNMFFFDRRVGSLALSILHLHETASGGDSLLVDFLSA